MAMTATCVQDSMITVAEFQIKAVINSFLHSNKGAFKNYVDKRGWVGGQSNVYESK